MAKICVTRTSMTGRYFTAKEIAETATGTALVIDDADFGYIAIIPMKDKRYLQMFLSKNTCKRARVGMIIELTKACVLVKTTSLYEDSVLKNTKEEKYLHF